MHLIWSFWFFLPIHCWWKWFQLQNWVITTTRFVPNSNSESSNNKPFVKSNLLRHKSHNTMSKIVYEYQHSLWETTYSRGNASSKAYRFCLDQALRLLCLKGHIRARGSTQWRHRWQEASEFWLTKTPFFGGSWATKNICKKTRACSLWRATNVTFWKILQLTPQK